MILFYKKNTGEVFGTIDGRVHGEANLNAFISPGLHPDEIGKFIIGWVEKDGKRMGYNLDKFELLQEFESVSPVSPLDFKVDLESGNLLKKDALVQNAELKEEKDSSDNEQPNDDAPINV